MKQFGRRLKALSITKKVGLGFVALFVIAGIAGSHSSNTTLNATTSGSHASSTQHLSSNSTKPATPASTTVVKTETDTQAIPFTATTVSDSSLAKGQTKVTIAGVNGSETLTYQVTYTGGQQTAKQLTNTTVTTPPITQVTHLGTYVAPPAPTCTNGSYVNSAGNRVCSPEASASVPVGATAKCGDGTYSFSQSRSGTCSHHGGVASWL